MFIPSSSLAIKLSMFSSTSAIVYIYINLFPGNYLLQKEPVLYCQGLTEPEIYCEETLTRGRVVKCFISFAFRQIYHWRCGWTENTFSTIFVMIKQRLSWNHVTIKTQPLPAFCLGKQGILQKGYRDKLGMASVLRVLRKIKVGEEVIESLTRSVNLYMPTFDMGAVSVSYTSFR